MRKTSRLRKISEVADQPLTWTQPGALKKSFELRLGDEPVATLEFRSIFGSFATGESADGCWTMKRVGFWQTRATVRPCEAEMDIAEFKDKTWSNGGTLTLADGRQFHATSSFWKSRLAIHDEGERELLVIQPRGLIHLSASVEIKAKARKMPELPWMLMLGWYLTVQKNEEDGAAAAAAAVS